MQNGIEKRPSRSAPNGSPVHLRVQDRRRSRSPDACPYFKVMSGIVEGRRASHQHAFERQASGWRISPRPSARRCSRLPNCTPAISASVAKAERYADRRHALRERRTASYSARSDTPEPSIAYAIAAKTRNDEDRMSTALAQDARRRPVAALLPRSADQGISAGRQRPAACGNRRSAG